MPWGGWVSRSLNNVLGPYLPVDLIPCCLAAVPEADVGPYCSILAIQVAAMSAAFPQIEVSWALCRPGPTGSGMRRSPPRSSESRQ